MPRGQSEANKISLAAARLRMKERCASDQEYRDRFVQASRKGTEVIRQMSARGELKANPAQRAALDAGRNALWKDPEFRKMRSVMSSETMKITNARRGTGEFPEWSKNREDAHLKAMDRLWKSPDHREKMKAVMSRSIKAHWKIPENRIRHSEQKSSLFTRLWKDTEFREKMATRPLPPGRGDQKIPFVDRKGNHLILRSTWEKKFAAWLDSQYLDWSYEPTAIDLKNGHRYFPDFWIVQWECFVEVKGFGYGLEKVARAIDLGWKIELLRSVSARAFRRLGSAHGIQG